MPMMPDPNSANRIRALSQWSLPSMPPTHIEPMHDIEVGEMVDFDQPQGGFEFDQPFGDSFIRAESGPEKGNLIANPDPLGSIDKPMSLYDQKRAFLRSQHDQEMQRRRDQYAAIKSRRY